MAPGSHLRSVAADYPVAPRHGAAPLLLALLPPIASAVLQQLMWPLLRPFAWLLFYPAVFFSISIGGRRGGILGTMLSTVLAWWFFVAPSQGFAKSEPRYFVAAAAFTLTGLAISVLHGRVHQANRLATAALARAHATNEQLREATDEITCGANELLRTDRTLRALSRCNQALIRATDEREWLEEVCRIAVDQAGYRMCWIGRAEHDDDKTVRPVAEAGFDDHYLERARITWADTERGRGPTGTAIRERRTVVAADIATDPTFLPWRDDALQHGYASSLSIPLVLDPSTMGAMTIYAHEPSAFGDQEIALLSEFADDLAYGIATLRTRAERDRAQADLRSLNAELEQRVASRTSELEASREREAETGERIQRMLLVDQPPHRFPGLRLAARAVPSERVSGDFYSFFPHEDRQCMDVLIADVMGKGVPAALLAAATKAHFPESMWHLMAASPEGGLPTPQDIVTLAHTHMARRLIELESFVTCCYARLDIDRQTLTFVDCGHTGIVHRQSATGRCSLLHGVNLPLGVREGEIYEQMSIPIAVGDTLLFFSDGVTEARNERGELFGPDRLLECVQNHAASDPSDLVAAVREATVCFAGRRVPTDDLTCVAVEVIPHDVPLARATEKIRSSLAELRRLRVFVETFCSHFLEPPCARSALVLAVNEAASNIIKHAYGNREDQRIEIIAEALTDRVSIRLRYLGAPFDPSVVPLPSFDGTRDGGFGVFLIANCVDTVRYYRDYLERRCILLEKRREPRPSGEASPSAKER